MSLQVQVNKQLRHPFYKQKKRTVICASTQSGLSLEAPTWVKQLGRLWGGKSDIPVVEARMQDISNLLGGGLFQALHKWTLETGNIYLLPTGPISSFLVVSDPLIIKHILTSSDNSKRPLFSKGLVAEASNFLFGDGFAVAGGEHWKARRKVVAPSLHRQYLNTMIKRVFVPSAEKLCYELQQQGTGPVNMEDKFSQLTLDVIGKALFNYDFNSLKQDSPIITAVYDSLKEVESRATDLVPFWRVPILCQIIPRQRRALAAVRIIRETTDEMIAKCKQMVDEEQDEFGEEYLNENDPSILRFLLASREEVTSSQLRDDLLSMLVAGHETTASVLTWTLYLLTQNAEQYKKAQAEADNIIGTKSLQDIDVGDYQQLKYTTRCISESMRLYPHPPVLLRRCLEDHELPTGKQIQEGQDILISIYSLHHSADLWENAEKFCPERFPLDEPIPTEVNTGYNYVPFSGGPRKCIGDQFALMEAVIALGVMLNKYDFQLVENQDIGMTTGATIHTTNGLYMTFRQRSES
eukprot:TRINITY_DN4391_c0_g1_i1.p1 TRINITY_DN4391_c0_g1~~TRINITY_DN4391_c0_g1_i1.p1  ORF type:complete len:530 (+),score=58.50 TRINITY_DN4391_c0_g1_i1:23-1591(+)